MTKQCIDCGVSISKRAKRCKRCAALRRWESENHRQKVSASMKEARKRDSFGAQWRQMHSDAMKKAHARGAYDTDSYRRKQAEHTRCRWANGEFDYLPALHSKRMKEAHAKGFYDEYLHTPECRCKRTAALRRRWSCGEMDLLFSNPEHRKRMSEIKERHWKRGVYKGRKTKPSQPEQDIAAALDTLGITYEREYYIPNYGKPFDFYIPLSNLLIEYDGEYWHSLPGCEERDAAKTEFARKSGYRIIRIAESTYEECDTIELLTGLLENGAGPCGGGTPLQQYSGGSANDNTNT